MSHKITHKIIHQITRKELENYTSKLYTITLQRYHTEEMLKKIKGELDGCLEENLHYTIKEIATDLKSLIKLEVTK